MEWVEITVEGVIARMPTDVKARYDAWLVSYPDKANRLAEITANTIREFRDNIKSVPKNYWHENETYLPQSAVRHVDTIIVFTLAMEMGLSIDSAGTGARYAADIFLRQILMGRYTTTTEEGGEGTPRYNAPTRDTAGRALPAFLAVMLAFVQFAAGGWIRPDSGPMDTDVETTFTPSAYSITTASLFSHLQGINAALGPLATTNYVQAAIEALEITNSVDATARALASSASIAANAALTSLTGYLPLSGYEDLVVLGTRTRGYAASTNLGSYGFSAGFDTYAGYAGFAAGLFTYAGNHGFAAGANTIAGDYGFAAGRAAKGAEGSFVFADNSAGGTSFYRTNRPNEFSARAAGGVYFDTPLMAVTGTVSAGSITLGGETRTTWPTGGGSGATQLIINAAGQYAVTSTLSGAVLTVTDLPVPAGGGGGTGWTNLAFSGTGNAITNATAAGTTLTLERGTIEGGGGGGTSTNDVRSIRDEAFRPYTTLGLSGGTALVTRASGQWVMIEADDGEVTLDVDVAAYTNSLEAIRHQICWVRGTNETYVIVTNNIDNTLFVDLPVSTTNHLFLERRPGWPRFQIWQDFR